MGEGAIEATAAVEQFYDEALEIYERACCEVTIPRSDWTAQKYAAVRYKQQIERGYREGILVPTIAKIIRQRTSEFDHLENAGLPDLVLETLVLDALKPYHHLFTPATVRTARVRMDEYFARHPEVRR